MAAPERQAEEDGDRRYPDDVADTPHVFTADEMDGMTPDQRAALIAERSHTNLAELPDEFRQKVITTAQRLAAQLDDHHAR